MIPCRHDQALTEAGVQVTESWSSLGQDIDLSRLSSLQWAHEIYQQT